MHVHVLNSEHRSPFAGLSGTECTWLGLSTNIRIYKVEMYFVLVAKWGGHYGSVLVIYVILLLLVAFSPHFCSPFFPFLLVHMESSIVFGSVCVSETTASNLTWGVLWRL